MKNIKKYYKINALPEYVFKALTNPVTIELWTGSPAIMDDQAGTEFSLWDGDISGKNLEVEPDRKLVQEWYFGDQEEASIVTIKLHPDGKGTSVELLHINIPDDDFVNILEGWDKYYFGALKELVEE
ncbi:MAG: SRPBCC domain-containing protein [Bacteroidales bacterium]